MTANGVQGAPYGSFRPGGSLEHEPVDRAEAIAMHTAQSAVAHTAQDDDEGDGRKPVVFDHAQVGRDIRAALRPDMF